MVPCAAVSTSSIRSSVLFVLVGSIATTTVTSAQTTPARRAAAVIASVPALAAAADAGPVSELTINWRIANSATDEPRLARDIAPIHQFQMTSRHESGSGGLVRERAPQLSTEYLVVIAVDAGGRELSWQHIRDPRIVRAETPGANGTLTGQTLYRPVAELMVTVPDALATAVVRIYEVQWNGTEFILQMLGEVAMVAR